MEETTTTTENNPENNPGKIKTAQLTTRVKVDDKDWYSQIASGFTIHHEAFSVLRKIYEENINKTKSVPEIITETVTVQVEKPIPENAAIVHFMPGLFGKLGALCRLLRKKGDIPADCTEQEFMDRLVSKALEAYIKKHYDFLNR